MRGFIRFMRTQGIMGLAVAFIIGAATQDFFKALSTDILTPVVGRAMGALGDISNASSTVAGVKLGWGNFLMSFINLVLMLLIVYFIVTYLHAKTPDKDK